jgi:hypothetical protein
VKPAVGAKLIVNKNVLESGQGPFVTYLIVYVPRLLAINVTKPVDGFNIKVPGPV